MLVIVGASGSGKTTLQKYICEKDKLQPIISVTTRLPRNGEENEKDYFFISNDEYCDMLNNNEFIEAAVYNGWNYGITKDQLSDDKVFVATPSGLRRLKRYIKENNLEDTIHLTSIYIKVDKISRLIKLLQRDGEERMNESIRRLYSDEGQFDGVEEEVDMVIDNSEYRLSIETIYYQIKNYNNMKLFKKEYKCKWDSEL